jgi:L-threonylcarbamoyladenylate synthase
METKLVPADAAGIAEGARLLQRGEVVAFPTETVYGLGANALDAAAVQRIFEAKERPADNPLIVHISDMAQLDGIAESIPAHAAALMKRFWPGPLSLVLPKHASVPSITTAGLDTVVVRFPSHPVAQALISAAGVPIAAPSANRSGNVSPTTAHHVWEDLTGRIPLILDGGDIEFGLESTVVDCSTETPTILRPGSVTLEMLQEVVPSITPHSDAAPIRSPGMKYRHYSPSAPVTLFIGPVEATERAMREQTTTEHSIVIAHSFAADIELPLDASAAAPLVYKALRDADKHQPQRILFQGYLEDGVGAAIMNRLRKAAESVVEVDH